MANSQKFIARNRAPRVQIEYDVELYDELQDDDHDHDHDH